MRKSLSKPILDEKVLGDSISDLIPNTMNDNDPPKRKKPGSKPGPDGKPKGKKKKKKGKKSKKGLKGLIKELIKELKKH